MKRTLSVDLLHRDDNLKSPLLDFVVSIELPRTASSHFKYTIFCTFIIIIIILNLQLSKVLCILKSDCPMSMVFHYVQPKSGRIVALSYQELMT